MTERKRLFRSKSNRVFFGVCGGIGDYLNVDPNAVRIAAVLLSCTGAGLLAYIIATVLLPER
jgi:phage shock protein PspC (stress-responsive transcriptional regulator)